MNDDQLFDVVADLDPTRIDRPPAVGSPRFETIQEKIIMTVTADTAKVTADPTHHTGATVPPARQRSRGVKFVAAAAAVAAVAIGGAVVWPDSAVPAAAAAVSAASDNIEDVTRLRVEMTVTHDSGALTVWTGEINGRDAHLRSVSTYSDGTTEEQEIISLGDTEYWSVGGGAFESSPVGPEGKLMPFGRSSAAVLNAALTDASVTDIGTDTIDGVEVRHVEIALSDVSRTALSALSPGELSWFELEYPDEVTTIDVWLDGEIIRRVALTDTWGYARDIRYFDLNADITITPPS